MLTFGTKIDDQEYKDRTAAYGVIMKNNKVAIVHTPRGYFLPGGGIDPGETPEQAVIREIEEELGWKSETVQDLGQADQYFKSPTSGTFYFNKGYFFICKENGSAGHDGEADHVLEWHDPRDIMSKMFHESQAWAIKQALEDYE